MSLALIERQLALKNRQVKTAEPDLAALIKQAVAEALAEAGVISAQPKAPPSPPMPPRIARMLRPARDYTPLPPSPPAPRPAPLPVAPAPVAFPDSVIERDELGGITGMSGQYGKLTVKRDHNGLIHTVYLNGKPLTKFARGFDGRIVKLEPPKEARP